MAHGMGRGCVHGEARTHRRRVGHDGDEAERRALLLCDVAVGRVYTTTNAFSPAANGGSFGMPDARLAEVRTEYDSIQGMPSGVEDEANTLNYQETVVYSQLASAFFSQQVHVYI